VSDKFYHLLVSYRDWNWIVRDHLAQGAYPGADPRLFSFFDVIVYSAMEAQPKLVAPAGKMVLRVPMDDDIYRPVPRDVIPVLWQSAAQIARAVRHGKRVLVTCMQGKNRSGLLVALTLLQLYPTWTPQQAIAVVRRHRKLGGGEEALANPMFEQFLLAQR